MREAIVGAAFAACIAVAGSAVVGASPSAEISFDQAAFDAGQQAGKPIMANWCTTCPVQKPIIDALRFVHAAGSRF